MVRGVALELFVSNHLFLGSISLNGSAIDQLPCACLGEAQPDYTVVTFIFLSFG